MLFWWMFLEQGFKDCFWRVVCVPISTRLSNRSGWPLLPSEITLRADLTLPSIMSLENVLDI